MKKAGFLDFYSSVRVRVCAYVCVWEKEVKQATEQDGGIFHLCVLTFRCLFDVAYAYNFMFMNE